MYVNKIFRVGNSESISIPPALLTALGWERGDYLVVRMSNANEITLRRFEPAQVPDRFINLVEPLEEK